MFDRWRGSQEGKDQGDQEYHRALSTLYQQVRSVIAAVDNIARNLAPDYPQEALSSISGRFESISREFTSYTIATQNMFFEIVKRSNARRNAARAVASQAKNVAKLFERYARKPKSYSKVESRLEIHKLREMLENMASHCN